MVRKTAERVVNTTDSIVWVETGKIFAMQNELFDRVAPFN